MRVEVVTKEEALSKLPETFDDVEGESELTEEQYQEAAGMVLAVIAANPGQHYFRVVLE
jgi:hypothetical protein